MSILGKDAEDAAKAVTAMVDNVGPQLKQDLEDVDKALVALDAADLHARAVATLKGVDSLVLEAGNTLAAFHATLASVNELLKGPVTITIQGSNKP